MMNYEIKYKKALKWMQGLYNGLHGATKEEAEKYFPELKESEDEIIRKGLINGFKECLKDCKYPKNAVKYWHNVEIDSILAWLEKQGENKPTDEVEPKFKIDDWIVGNEGIFKVTQYEDEYGYELTDTTGCVVYFVSPDYVESNFHLWTIQDAKDGDVLATENFIFIFKNIDNGNGVHYYCQYEISKHENDNQFDIALPQSLMGRVGNSISHYSPATKEQRDLLFQKMKEAGYEWDAQKKEVKKTEPKKVNANKVINWVNPDKVIEWLKNTIRQKAENYGVYKETSLILPYNSIEDLINDFKEDFGL